MRSILGCLLLAVLPAGWVAAQEVEQCVAGGPAYAAVDPLIDSFMQSQHVPGLVYGIVHRGRLVHCGTRGVRDVKSGDPVTFDTVFRIASMTKSFTALAVLKLRDAGKIELDSPAGRWIPQLAGSPPQATGARPIRVRDLLAHTVGYVTDDPWGDRQLALPEAEFTRMLDAGVPPARMPGVAFEYSNYGYALLGRIVATAAKTPYSRYMQQELLRPLGMVSSGLEVAEIDPARRAIGYRYEDSNWREEPVLADGAFAAMGGLHTSARDYVQYVRFLLDAWTDRAANRSQVVAAASRRELGQGAAFPILRPADANDPTSCATSIVYGFGMVASADCRFKYSFGHSGGLPGYGSNVLLIPEYDLGIFVFTNRTYAPAAGVVKQAASRLYDLGSLQAVAQAPSEALLRIEKAVANIYSAGSVNAEPRALADNLLLDRSAAKRDEELRAVRTKLGACRANSKMDVKHALSAVIKYSCERGTLVATVLLAPVPEPSLQKLELAAQD